VIYTTRTTQSQYSTLFLLLITVVVVAAGAVIVMEALRLPQIGGSIAGTTAVTFGLMLVSLAGVVLSVVLPDRVGKALLLMGAIGFFACLAFALVNGIRF
jgi:uncharacterized membrane protein YkvI